MGSEEKRERTWKGNCSSSKKPRNKKANLSIVSPLFKKLFHSMCFPGQTHLREVKQQRKCSCWLISPLIHTINHDSKQSIMMRTLKKSLHTLIIRKNCTKPARRFSFQKPFRSRNRIGSKIRLGLCFATPRAELAKFDTWYTVHGPWYISKPFRS